MLNPTLMQQDYKHIHLIMKNPLKGHKLLLIILSPKVFFTEKALIKLNQQESQQFSFYAL